MAGNIPESDIWYLIDNDINSQWYGKKFKFDFSYIKSDSVKNVVKAYTWRNYKENNITLNSLYRYINSYFTKVINFLNQQQIVSLKVMTNNDVDMLVSYMNTLVSPKDKGYSLNTKKYYSLGTIISA